MTDNKNRSAAEVRSTFSKYNGNLGVSGCVKHNFKRVGVISYDKSVSNFEDFFDYCASVDVDDVTENENDFVLETNLDNFNTILQKLENKFSITPQPVLFKPGSNPIIKFFKLFYPSKNR